MPQIVSYSMRERSLVAVSRKLYATVKMFYHIKEWPDCSLASCLLHYVSFCYNWLKNQYRIDILNKRVSLFDAQE